jgi:hypothetical protein
MKMLTSFTTTLKYVAAQIRNHKLHKRLSIALVHTKLTTQRESNLNQEAQSGFPLNGNSQGLKLIIRFQSKIEYQLDIHIKMSICYV